MRKTVIREYDPQDKDQVKAVVLEVMKELRPGYRLRNEKRNEDLDNILKFYGGKGRFWVVEDEGRVIGTVAVREDKNGVAWLKRLFLLAGYRGKGIGSNLLKKALDYCKKQCFTTIHAITSTHAVIAEQMLVKNDFKLIKKDEELLFYSKRLVL